MTTKGLELKGGAPNAVLRKRVVRSAAADTSAETAAAVADNEVKETAKAEPQAEAKAETKTAEKADTVSEKAKAELESVRDKTDEKKQPRLTAPVTKHPPW